MQFSALSYEQPKTGCVSKNRAEKQEGKQLITLIRALYNKIKQKAVQGIECNDVF